MPKTTTGPKQGKRSEVYNEDVIRLVSPGGEQSYAVVIVSRRPRWTEAPDQVGLGQPGLAVGLEVGTDWWVDIHVCSVAGLTSKDPKRRPKRRGWGSPSLPSVKKPLGSVLNPKTCLN